MISKYFESYLGHIFDLAEKYDSVKEKIDYIFQFFALAYDLSLREFEFLIESLYFERDEISKNKKTTALFKLGEVKDELLSLSDKGYVKIERADESDDDYYYVYDYTVEASFLYVDFMQRLSAILEKYRSAQDVVPESYLDSKNSLADLLDDLKILADDKHFLELDSNADISSYSYRFDLLIDLKKSLNKKYSDLKILSFEMAKEHYDDEDFDHALVGLIEEGRHKLEIEYTENGKKIKKALLVKEDDYEDIIEVEDLDEKTEDGEAFTHFVMLMDDFNRDHKKIKEKLRNLYEFIAPAYDLTLAEFEFCLYYTTIYSTAYDEIYDIDGYFIEDSKKIVTNLIEKGYIYSSEDGFILTEKSDAVFKHMGALFANTMEKNKADYDRLLTCVNNYYDASETLEEFTDNFAYRFSFEDFDVEEQISDEIDEYSLGVPFEKAVANLLAKKFTNPKVLSLTDEGDYIEVIFITDDYKGKTLAGYLNKEGINEM
ncbi:hypothetical protein [Anaerococcus lactolyticus]|uniref:hypothetical protein n=1 Tax=Anaerococcus lactolyticus TaxID=33032 RepID=UPI0023F02168|nr:hypothetical protein [Anaerococcus lactolyticus]